MSDDGSADEARERYEVGRAALVAGALDAAISHLEASIAEYPHFKALELLGDLWLRKGEPRRAIVPLAAATTLNPQVRAPSLLAEALLALGDQLEAYRVAQLALDRDPNNEKARSVKQATSGAYRAWSEL